MRNKFVYQTAYVLLAFTLFLNPVNVLSADKTPDAEANMNAYNARTFFDYLMSPFTSIKESSGLASSQYKVVPVKGKILFSSSSNGNAVLYMLSNGIVSEICRNGKDARWSHDGTKFLCLPTGDDIKWSMAIVNDQGKLLRIIKPFENGAVHEACFSPKFQNIIYFKGRKDQYTRDYLYSIDINSNKVTQVSSIAIDSFEVSPDGTRIVYSAPRDEKDETSQGSIWIMNVDGSNTRKLTNIEGDSSPAWSPNGEYIAFSSLGKNHDIRQIYIMDKNGGNLSQITKSPFSKNNPCWSPDGIKLCYEAYTHNSATDQSELFVINWNGTQESRILNMRKSLSNQWPTLSNPHWAAD